MTGVLEHGDQRSRILLQGPALRRSLAGWHADAAHAEASGRRSGRRPEADLRPSAATTSATSDDDAAGLRAVLLFARVRAGLRVQLSARPIQLVPESRNCRFLFCPLCFP